MSLAKNLFVTMAFNAKTHNILTHGHPVHPTTHKLLNIEDHISSNIQQIIAKIEEKEHKKNSGELQSLKKLALDLRKEFDDLKRE